jgi:hypothetical protein
MPRLENVTYVRNAEAGQTSRLVLRALSVRVVFESDRREIGRQLSAFERPNSCVKRRGIICFSMGDEHTIANYSGQNGNLG